MFHRTILGVPGGNLDTYFTGEAKTKEIFMEETPEDAFAVVEGVMGLYDGLGGIFEEGSTYHLAKAISLPVILGREYQKRAYEGRLNHQCIP